MNVPISKPVLAGILCLGALSFIGAVPAAVRIAGSIVLILYLPGLAFLSLVSGRVRPALDYLFVPFIISPIVIAIPALAFFFATGSLHLSTALAALIPVLAVFSGLFIGKRGNDALLQPVPRAILLISFAFGALVLVAYLLNHFLLYRIDAWYHISVVNEIVNRGIPPRDPWLADEPIRYMWIFHFFIAGFGEFAGVGASWAMGIFNVINAFAFPYVVARLTALYRTDKRFTLGTPLFALASLSSVAWILWPVVLIRALFGDVKGSEEIARIVHDVSINGNQVVHFLAPYGLWMVNLIDKFYVITAFNHALNLFLLCFVTIASVDLRARTDARVAVTVFFVTLGAMLFHVILGAALVAGVVGSAVLLVCFRHFDARTEKPFPAFHVFAAPGAAIAAAAVALPYIVSLMGGQAGGGQSGRLLHLGIKSILTIAAPLAILFPFSRSAFRELKASWSGVHRILAAWIVALAALSIVVDLPARNESKLIFPVFLLLTPLVAWQIVEALHRARGARLVALSTLVGVLFAVPSVLTVLGFFLEKPVNPVEIKRMTITQEERDLFSWIATRTALDAVIMEGNTYNRMPVYAARRGFFPDEGTVNVLGYGGEKVDRSRRLRDDMFSEAPLREDDRRYLLGMKQDLYIVVWREDLVRIPGLDAKLADSPALFERVYRNPDGTVFRLPR